MEYQSTQRCAFPPCTICFPLLNAKKKYCSGCCRTKDCNRRKLLQERTSLIPVKIGESKIALEPISLNGPTANLQQTENAQPEPKGGMSLAGVGESAIGTAGVLFMKDQLFDKDHRNQLQRQMDQLLRQQALIAQQLQEVNKKMEMLSNGITNPLWTEKLLM